MLSIIFGFKEKDTIIEAIVQISTDRFMYFEPWIKYKEDHWALIWKNSIEKLRKQSSTRIWDRIIIFTGQLFAKKHIFYITFYKTELSNCLKFHWKKLDYYKSVYFFTLPCVLNYSWKTIERIWEILVLAATQTAFQNYYKLCKWTRLFNIY